VVVGTWPIDSQQPVQRVSLSRGEALRLARILVRLVDDLTFVERASEVDLRQSATSPQEVRNRSTNDHRRLAATNACAPVSTGLLGLFHDQSTSANIR
jgi:hypothetical protein